MNLNYEPDENDYLIFNYKNIYPKDNKKNSSPNTTMELGFNQVQKATSLTTNSDTVNALLEPNQNTNKLIQYIKLSNTKASKVDLLKRANQIVESMEYGNDALLKMSHKKSLSRDSAVILKRDQTNIYNNSYHDYSSDTDPYEISLLRDIRMPAQIKTTPEISRHATNAYPDINTKYKYYYWSASDSKQEQNNDYLSLFDISPPKYNHDLISKKKISDLKLLNKTSNKNQYISLSKNKKYTTPENTSGETVYTDSNKVFKSDESTTTNEKNTLKSYKPLDSSVMMLVQLGFSAKTSTKALQQTNGDTSDAIDLLLKQKTLDKKIEIKFKEDFDSNTNTFKTINNTGNYYNRREIFDIAQKDPLLDNENIIAKDLNNFTLKKITEKEPSVKRSPSKNSNNGVQGLLDKAKTQIIKNAGNWLGLGNNKNSSKPLDNSSQEYPENPKKLIRNKTGFINKKLDANNENLTNKPAQAPISMASFIKPSDARYTNPDDQPHDTEPCASLKNDRKLVANDKELKNLTPIPYIAPSVFLAANDEKENGIMHYRLNKFKMALENFNTAIKFMSICPEHPFYIILYNNLASTLYKLGKHKYAIEALNKAIILCKKFMDHKILKLNIGGQQNNFTNPNNSSNYVSLNLTGLSDVTVDTGLYYKKCVFLKATVYEVLKDYTNAIKEYKIFETEPRDPHYEKQARYGISRCKSMISKISTTTNIVFDQTKEPSNNTTSNSKKYYNNTKEKKNYPNMSTNNNFETKQITKKKAYPILSSVSYQDKFDEWEKGANGDFITLLNTVYKLSPDIKSNNIQPKTNFYLVKKVFLDTIQKFNPKKFSQNLTETKKDYYYKIFVTLNNSWIKYSQNYNSDNKDCRY
ncbi:hypothetical protein BB561_003671 [Smittium simulii]|uniref:UBA domain-containing protein n=1 Tax=Smittium simulii TaxID=133385 RepID=A0A2T9YK39_9FUNG|nr:hypothetical protein BB561_003671 [Smittium simulii]